MAAAASPEWSEMMSNRDASRNESRACSSSGTRSPKRAILPSSEVVTSRAWVIEPPHAYSVTSCPSSARRSASSDTTHSTPPYRSGGTGSHGGAMIAIFRCLETMSSRGNAGIPKN